MDDSDHPLGQPRQPLDAEGRTIDEALAAEEAANGSVLHDWLSAKDRRDRGLDAMGTHAPTPKAPPPTKIRPDLTTPAGQYRGRPAPQEPKEEKTNWQKYPRRQLRPNDRSSGGWSK